MGKRLILEYSFEDSEKEVGLKIKEDLQNEGWEIISDDPFSNEYDKGHYHAIVFSRLWE